MDFWIRAAQLVLSLSILVVLHEFGHYIPAKLFKTRVEKFYLFFNPWFSLFKRKVGETEWGIGWLPLGGYVKIAGMVDESMDKEQLKEPAKPWEFRSKPAWQRLIIMIGGVTVNLILGILIYIFVLFSFGYDTLKTDDLKAGLAVHPYMEQFGFKPGDVVLSVDGKKLDLPTDATLEILFRGGRNVVVKHLDGKTETLNLPEDVDYKMFENNALPAFSLRTNTEKIHLFFALNDFQNSIKKMDVLYSVNGKKLNEISDLKQETAIKMARIEVIRDQDTLIQTLPGASLSKALISCFPALWSGMKTNDKLLSINGNAIDFHDQVGSELYSNKNKDVELAVLRGKDTVQLTSKIAESGMLGVSFKNFKPIDKQAIHRVYPSFGESIQKGWNKGFLTLSDYVSQMKFVFTKKGAGSISGFGGIGKMFPPKWDWEVFWMNTAFISIVLAFMNILPIPALDGGHVVFLLYEIITGKEAPQKVLEYAQYAGFILLLSLMLYANGNDIFQAFFK